MVNRIINLINLYKNIFYFFNLKGDTANKIGKNTLIYSKYFDELTMKTCQ
jgi:hypothetical protein